jgi:hypothetical protein
MKNSPLETGCSQLIRYIPDEVWNLRTFSIAIAMELTREQHVATIATILPRVREEP